MTPYMRWVTAWRDARNSKKFFRPTRRLAFNKRTRDGFCVHASDMASCCFHMGSTRTLSVSRGRIYDHLNTIVHFKRWCLGTKREYPPVTATPRVTAHRALRSSS